MKLTAKEAQRLALWYAAIAADYEQAAQSRGKYSWQLMRAADGAKQQATRYWNAARRLAPRTTKPSAVRNHAHA